MNKVIAMVPDVSMWVQSSSRRLLNARRTTKDICDQLMRRCLF